MLNAKVKLRNIRTGQESLLLVVKMNLKGILVRPSQPIAPDTPLLLSLQLHDDGLPLELRGEVHKIAKHPGGTSGVIIRFVNPSDRDAARILEYLKNNAPEMGTEASGKPRSPSREITASTKIASISKLALSSPDRDAGSVAATADEIE